MEIRKEQREKILNNLLKKIMALGWTKEFFDNIQIKPEFLHKILTNPEIAQRRKYKGMNLIYVLVNDETFKALKYEEIKRIFEEAERRYMEWRERYSIDEGEEGKLRRTRKTKKEKKKEKMKDYKKILLSIGHVNER